MGVALDVCMRCCAIDAMPHNYDRIGVSVHEKGADDDDTNNLGYVHRFPDLLKRWDDVDGDRGTW